jgi:GNAT superfamily N-acetyltransferase
MDLVTKPVVTGTEAEACWSFYDRAFEDLRIKAAQRHALTRDEFEDVMVDSRVDKILVTKDRAAGPCGMATLTNDLKAVPLISPEYYQARWPQFYAEQKIYYVGFLAVDPNYHGTGVLSKLLSSMCDIVPAQGGMIAADICSFNEDVLKLPELFARVFGTFRPKPALNRLDAQTYWSYEFASSA